MTEPHNVLSRCSECGAPWKTCKCPILRDSENSAVPVPDTIADCVMMRFAEIGADALTKGDLRVTADDLVRVAAALFSHGLREFVEAGQSLIDGSMLVASGTTYVPRGRFERFEKALITMLGEGETLKAEEQADGR